MKKMFRKALALMLVVCIAMGLLAAPGLGKREVRAAETSGDGDYEYVVLDENTVRIKKYIGADEKIIVPTSIDRKKVAAIGPNAFEKSTAKAIIIPDGITNIDSYAFFECRNLKTIHIPSSVKNIGRYAFAVCENLTNVVLSNGVESIGDNAFYCCMRLEEITIPASVTSLGNNAFDATCASLSKIHYAGTQEQWGNLAGAATGNTALQNAEIKYNFYYTYKTKSDGTIEITGYVGPDSNTVAEIPESIDGKSVTSIGELAFLNCKNLAEFVIPQSVISISVGAFQNCTGLKKISVPAGVTEIDKNVFSGCGNLTEISIPLSVKNIQDSAFYNCSRLSDVHYAGTADQWKEISISSTENEKLLKATIHCAASGDILYGNHKYKILDDDTVEIQGFVGEGMLGYAVILDRISGRCLTSIGKSCFAGCSAMYGIKISDNVNRIMENAFKGCERLTDVYYSGSKSQWEKISIDPTGNEALLKATIHYEKSDELTSGDYKYKVLDDGTVEIIKYIGSDSSKSVEIPEKIDGKSVTGIGSFAFENCEALETVSIPVGVISIKENAFLGCANLSDVYYAGEKQQWEKVKIDKTGNDQIINVAAIHYIDPSKKYRYRILEDGSVEITGYVGEDTVLDIPAMVEERRVTSIGYAAFKNCTKLKKIIIPNSVTIINALGFSGCTGLEEITIPNSVTILDSSVFLVAQH